MINFMLAGQCFMQPREDDLRIVVGKVTQYLPDNADADFMGDVASDGLIVQQFEAIEDEQGFELCGGGRWQSLCPLADFPILYPSRLVDLPDIMC